MSEYRVDDLARLRLVLDLLERGYTFAQIHEMISAWEAGRDLGDLLGLEEVLTQPWSDEVPLQLTLAELATEFGGYADASTLDSRTRSGHLRATGRCRPRWPSR